MITTPLLAVLVACSTPPEPPTAPPPADAPAEETAKGTREDIDLAGLEKALESEALVVDVRTDQEWKAGHVPGAEHMPLSSLKVDAPLFTEHGKDTPIYLICESGGRSARAADALAEAGYHAVNVEGGTGAWRSAGKPLETP